MNLAITIEGDSWNEEEVKPVVEKCVQAVFDEVGLNDDNVEVCFLFTTDEEVRSLNKTYRGINKPTNVLSFPADILSEDAEYCILGSIALAFETVEREAREQKKSFYDHLKHLLVHGMLHLFRYDHAEESEAEQMEALEAKILKKLNVKDPYLQEEPS
ncbi:MAG: rRNA maturation RNase YbeY [Holosporaceae bacterium]|jgi:probable rRNA maturation factor|nr:rRNA maturation RNase YbeY [Holosporaceae bacterium]